MIIGLFVFSLSGCQQVNDLVNGNTATNSNATANTNANSNANSNANAKTSVMPTNSAPNANTQASNTVANTATATKEEVPLTQEAKVFKNNLVGEWETTDGWETWKFSEDKFEAKRKSGKEFGNPRPYQIVDEKTIKYDKGAIATITFEDNGNTLIWVGGGSFKLKRVNPK